MTKKSPHGYNPSQKYHAYGEKYHAYGEKYHAYGESRSDFRKSIWRGFWDFGQCESLGPIIMNSIAQAYPLLIGWRTFMRNLQHGAESLQASFASC